MKKILLGLLIGFFSINVLAAEWTVESTVKYVRTYNGVNYAIGLNELRCPNEKDYFQVQNVTNSDAFFSIALAALLSGKKIQVLYEVDSEGVHCYVSGIWIVQ